MNYIKKYSIACLFFAAFLSQAFATNTLIDVHGKKIPFDSLKGKWVFINYWASWCQPCLDEITELNKFNQNKPDNVVLFAVNFDALPLENQLQLIKKLNINYPSLSEDPSDLLHLGYVQGVPATFVFDPQGQLRTTLYGSQTVRSLNEAIQG